MNENVSRLTCDISCHCLYIVYCSVTVCMINMDSGSTELYMSLSVCV